MHRPTSICLLASLVLIGMGCQSNKGPDVLTVESSSYNQAFDAAVEAANQWGMPARMRDRRNGVIETDPAIASSIFEPWKTDNPTFSDAMENTLGMHRRTVRFEFTPVGFEESVLRATEVLTGPDMVALGSADLDLTDYKGELELRAWVFLERAGQPGYQRNSWTRNRSGVFVANDPGRQTQKGIIWTSVHRDEAFERRLLATVSHELSHLSDEAVDAQIPPTQRPANNWERGH